jgi:hypothetical protein
MVEIEIPEPGGRGSVGRPCSGAHGPRSTNREGGTLSENLTDAAVVRLPSKAFGSRKPTDDMPKDSSSRIELLQGTLDMAHPAWLHG